jgi:hypothetical protein
LSKEAAPLGSLRRSLDGQQNRLNTRHSISPHCGQWMRVGGDRPEKLAFISQTEQRSG